MEYSGRTDSGGSSPYAGVRRRKRVRQVPRARSTRRSSAGRHAAARCGVYRSARVKVVILAGGLGTRLAEETEIKPKPMVEIGGRPILWHILKHYSFYGFNEFFIALGYKSESIKRYFMDYYALN